MNENSATSQTRKYGMVGSAIRWLAISVGGLAGALVLIALVVMIFGILIELNGVKDKIELAQLSLRDIVLTHRDASTDKTFELALEEIVGSAEDREPMRGKGLALDFDLTGPKLKDLDAILDTTLPPIQSFGLKGRLEEAEGRYRIVDLTGEIANTGATGNFEAGTSGAKLRLRKFCEQAWSSTAVIPSSSAFG